MITGYIFDFDGTLARSLSVWREADRKFLSARGLTEPEGFYQSISHMNLIQASEYIVRLFGLPETAEEAEREFLEIVRDEYANEISLVPGAREYLKKIKNASGKIALATSNQEELYRPCLERNGVYGLFDAFVTTAEAGCSKGEPEIYLLAAEKLGLPPEECEVFEDILPGVLAAKAAGMRCTAVLEERSRGDWEEIKRTADGWIADYVGM